MTPPHNGINIATQFQDLLKLLGSIATILAIYTGLNWYVVHIYFESLSTQISTVNTHVVSIDERYGKDSRQIAVNTNRLDNLEKQSGIYETKGKPPSTKGH